MKNRKSEIRTIAKIFHSVVRLRTKILLMPEEKLV